VGVLDWLVFRNVDKLSRYLDPSRLAATEPVFDVLLSVLAVQLMVDDLAELGITSVVVGH
jgi:small neutral amino acid transporter SnatA (MarC family)